MLIFFIRGMPGNHFEFSVSLDFRGVAIGEWMRFSVKHTVCEQVITEIIYDIAICTDQ